MIFVMFLQVDQNNYLLNLSRHVRLVVFGQVEEKLFQVSVREVLHLKNIEHISLNWGNVLLIVFESVV